MGQVETVPMWARCPWCADFVCTVHEQHVGDCECPPLEAFIENDIDPYTEGGNPEFYRDAIEPLPEYNKD